MTNAASGLPSAKIFSALLLAFCGPIPQTIRNTSLGPQRKGEPGLDTSAILSTGRASKPEAAKM
jgi:hypothetical protein